VHVVVTVPSAEDFAGALRKFRSQTWAIRAEVKRRSAYLSPRQRRRLKDRLAWKRRRKFERRRALALANPAAA